MCLDLYFAFMAHACLLQQCFDIEFDFHCRFTSSKPFNVLNVLKFVVRDIL